MLVDSFPSPHPEELAARVAMAMMGGDMQGMIDNLIVGQLQAVEAAVDDELDKIENLGVR